MKNLKVLFEKLNNANLNNIILNIKDIEDDLTNADFKSISLVSIFGFDHASYNEKVEADILLVIDGVFNKKYSTTISKESGLSENHVELIQSILCDKGLCDYGTSPRGCYFNSTGLDLYNYYKKIKHLLLIK